MSLITSATGRVRKPGLMVGTVQNEQVNGHPRVAWTTRWMKKCPQEGHIAESPIRRVAGLCRCIGCGVYPSRRHRGVESRPTPLRRALRYRHVRLIGVKSDVRAAGDNRLSAFSEFVSKAIGLGRESGEEGECYEISVGVVSQSAAPAGESHERSQLHARADTGDVNNHDLDAEGLLFVASNEASGSDPRTESSSESRMSYFTMQSTRCK